jgi:hypothetical protein
MWTVGGLSIGAVSWRLPSCTMQSGSGMLAQEALRVSPRRDQGSRGCLCRASRGGFETSGSNERIKRADQTSTDGSSRRSRSRSRRVGGGTVQAETMEHTRTSSRAAEIEIVIETTSECDIEIYR